MNEDKLIEELEYAVVQAMISGCSTDRVNAAKAALKSVLTPKNIWVKPSKRMPESGVPVLADIGEKYPIRAEWIERFSCEADIEVESEACEYQESDDMYYLCEGWYEWNRFEETHWLVDVEVLAWMPLPECVK